MGNSLICNKNLPLVCCNKNVKNLDNFVPTLKRNKMFENNKNEEEIFEEIKPNKKFIIPYTAFNNLFHQINNIIKIQRAYKKYKSRNVKKTPKKKNKNLLKKKYDTILKDVTIDTKNSFDINVNTTSSNAPKNFSTTNLKIFNFKDDEKHCLSILSCNDKNINYNTIKFNFEKSNKYLNFLDLENEDYFVQKKSSSALKLFHLNNSGTNIGSTLIFKPEIDPNEIYGNFLDKSNTLLSRRDSLTKNKRGFKVITYKDNSYIKGIFTDNKINGICKFYNSQVNSIFMGEYTNNIPNGYGIYKIPKGSYEGFWSKSSLVDIGIETYDDQSFYHGEFYNNKRDGIGTYRWPDGSIYQGEWINNQMTGVGIITYSDQRVYKGEVLNGMMNGFGEFSWRNGNIYFGNYVKDIKTGFGIFIWNVKNLHAYIGFWDKGKKNGVGVNVNGNIVKYGIFKDGKKESNLLGPKEMKRFLNNDQLKYEKILNQNPQVLIKSLFEIE